MQAVESCPWDNPAQNSRVDDTSRQGIYATPQPSGQHSIVRAREDVEGGSGPRGNCWFL